jgi:hypothetical protein
MASCLQTDIFIGIYWDSLDEEPASRKASDYTQTVPRRQTK